MCSNQTRITNNKINLMKELNIGKPKEKSTYKLLLVLVVIFLSQLPAFNSFFQGNGIMALLSPAITIPILSFLSYKQWSNEYKYSRIRTENKTLYIRRCADIESYPFHEINKIKARSFIGLKIMVLKSYGQTHWYFVGGFSSSELGALRSL